MNKKILVIEADENDADYLTETHEVTDEQIKQLKPIIKAIANFDGDDDTNWEDPEEQYAGKLTPKQIDFMNDFVPSGQDGIHTIISIKILHVTKEEQLL